MTPTKGRPFLADASIPAITSAVPPGTGNPIACRPAARNTAMRPNSWISWVISWELTAHSLPDGGCRPSRTDGSPGTVKAALTHRSVASGIARAALPRQAASADALAHACFAMAAGPSWRAPWRPADRAGRWPPDDRIAPHAIARRTGPASVWRRASRTTRSPATLCAESAHQYRRSLLTSRALGRASARRREHNVRRASPSCGTATY